MGGCEKDYLMRPYVDASRIVSWWDEIECKKKRKKEKYSGRGKETGVSSEAGTREGGGVLVVRLIDK
jgi:hypothetical protein